MKDLCLKLWIDNNNRGRPKVWFNFIGVHVTEEESSLRTKLDSFFGSKNDTSILILMWVILKCYDWVHSSVEQGALGSPSMPFPALKQLGDYALNCWWKTQMDLWMLPYLVNHWMQDHPKGSLRSVCPAVVWRLPVSGSSPPLLAVNSTAELFLEYDHADIWASRSGLWTHWQDLSI